MRWHLAGTLVSALLLLMGSIQFLLSWLQMAQWIQALPVWVCIAAVLYLLVLFILDWGLNLTHTQTWDLRAVLIAGLMTYGLVYRFLEGDVTLLMLIAFRPHLVPATILALGVTLLLETLGLHRVSNSLLRHMGEAVLVGQWIGITIVTLLGTATLYGWLTQTVTLVMSLTGSAMVAMFIGITVYAAGQARTDPTSPLLSDQTIVMMTGTAATAVAVFILALVYLR